MTGTHVLAGDDAATAIQKQVAGCLQLKHHEDMRSLGLVLFYHFLVVTRWHASEKFLAEYPQAAYMWFFLIASFSFVGATITHNCVHVPMFKKMMGSHALNNFWQIVLTNTYGHPVSTLIPGHNLSHHKHTQGPKDVMRTTRMRFDWNFLNLLVFVVSIVKAINKFDAAYFEDQKKKGRPIYSQVILESCCFYPIQVLLLYLNWHKFVFIILFPQLFAKWGIITMNLLQHDGCIEQGDQDGEYEGTYNFARNFTCPILNWFVCNNGFHTIHHLYPGWHWSRLPEEHQKRVVPHMHPLLDQQSMFGYMFRSFVLPTWAGPTCGRRWYDGRVYNVHEVPMVEDVPWYNGTSETYSSEAAAAAAADKVEKTTVAADQNQKEKVK